MNKTALAIAALAAAIAPALAEETAADPRDIWNGMVTSANHAYAGRELAILKIDDAIYLKPGQSAALVCGDTCRFVLGEAPADALAAVAYDGTAARLPGGRDLLAGKDPLRPREGIALQARQAEIAPGETGLRLAVFNQANPAAAAFQGLDWFDHDPAWTVAARFERAETFEPVTFQTSRGLYKDFLRVGWAVFTHAGQPVRLALYGPDDAASGTVEVSAFFTDAQAGAETYGVGRYLDLELDLDAAAVTLDFNMAYNPLCARSDHFNCPVATDALPFAVTAGERRPGAPDGDHAAAN